MKDLFIFGALAFVLGGVGIINGVDWFVADWILFLGGIAMMGYALYKT